MSVVRYLAGLAAAIAGHIVLQQYLPTVARVVDPFVIWIVAQGLVSSPPRAIFSGLLAGWCEDALSGASLYGLHGIAGTIVGYLVAQATRQLATTSLFVVGLLFAVAAAIHEAILMVLQLLLSASPVALDPTWVGVGAVVNAILGLAILRLGERLAGWGQGLRRSRKKRVRLGG